MKKKTIVSIAAITIIITITAIASQSYAGPFGLFGRNRSSCANGSCNSYSRSSMSVIVTDSTNSIDSIPVKDTSCDCKCDCKCGCDLCKCATECCTDSSGKCNCACGCPNCICASINANTNINPQGANNNSCATCNSGSCGPNSSCSQNSQVIVRSRSRVSASYGRKTPIRNILKKIFHR